MAGGGSIKWKDHDALDGLIQDEIKQLSVDDNKKREALSMEQNAWKVARDLAGKINRESGPAGDYTQSLMTPPNRQFFFKIRTTTAARENQ